jgi:hypothetical protein
MELLLLDLIHQGKIHGNVHIFKPKPKRKGTPPMKQTIKMDDVEIRVMITGSVMWLCLKDIWKWIGKPEHSYRKVTEGWGPDSRAKFQMETNSGRQHFIFINTQGLDKLFRHVDYNQIKMLMALRGEMINGLGISTIQQTTANKPRKGKAKQKATRRI